MLRFLHRAEGDLARISRVRVSSTVLTGIVVAAIGFFAIGSLRIHSPVLPSAALAISAGEVLVAFLLIIARTDVVSQAVGVFSLENGVFVASLVLAWGLPILLALALVFDLLVAVFVFAVVMRALHRRQETLSIDVLDRLRG
jgi:hydrogenase-4 component E